MDLSGVRRHEILNEVAAAVGMKAGRDRDRGVSVVVRGLDEQLGVSHI
jgi:hypothetical protein